MRDIESLKKKKKKHLSQTRRDGRLSVKPLQGFAVKPTSPEQYLLTDDRETAQTYWASLVFSFSFHIFTQAPAHASMEGLDILLSRAVSEERCGDGMMVSRPSGTG